MDAVGGERKLRGVGLAGHEIDRLAVQGSGKLQMRMVPKIRSEVPGQGRDLPGPWGATWLNHQMPGWRVEDRFAPRGGAAVHRRKAHIGRTDLHPAPAVFVREHGRTIDPIDPERVDLIEPIQGTRL